jgi:hypothetical protein
MSDENNYDEEVCETEVVPYESVEPNAEGGRLNSIGNLVSNANGLVSNANNLISKTGDIVKTIQEQKTKIAEIKADKEIKVKQIQAQTEMVKDVVSRSFAERKDNFKVMHKAVEKAMEEGDNEKLALALGAIVETQKHSVIKDIGESLKLGKNNQKQISLKDEEW